MLFSSLGAFSIITYGGIQIEKHSCFGFLSRETAQTQLA